ncbi:MAG: diacylglycerol kinase family lipid kinase [Clostridiales bacterium]|nr:diacylglycerol kinase family lipid kinase [Clostridiales bacterium]
MYYFIVNPVSRSGQGMKVWEQTKRTLDEKKIPYEVFFTEYCGHGRKLAKNIAAKASAEAIVCKAAVSETAAVQITAGEAVLHKLVCIGGDGTVNEVLNGLPLHCPVEFSYLPVGSGNDFARGLKLPVKPEEALQHILSDAKGRYMDLGTVKTQKRRAYFGISSGMGYDAEICHEVSHTPAKKWLNRLHLGKLVYVYAALKLLFSFRPSDMDVELDGGPSRHFSKVYFITGMNLQYQGGGFRFCPEASPEDGKLDFIIVHGLSKLKILFLFPTAYFAKHTHFRGITILRGYTMTVHSQKAYMIHHDGEYGGLSDTVTFGVKKQVLKLH